MPKEERPAQLTPVARRQRRRRGIFIFLTLLALILAALAAVVLTVNDGRNWHRIVRQYGLERYFPTSTPDTHLQVSRQKQLPAAALYPVRLLANHIEQIDLFRAQPHLPPAESCDRLKTASGPAPTFTETKGDWECLLSQNFGSAEDPASIFVQVKGNAREGLRSFRVKLSQTDPQEERTVLQHALNAVDRFDLDLATETRRYIAMKMAAKSGFRSFSANYVLSFQKEITDDRRFNLIILPLRADTDCAASPDTTPSGLQLALVSVPLGCLPWRADFGSVFPELKGR